MQEPLLTIKQLSEWLGVPEWTIRGWRQRGEGPPALKVGGAVRWRPSDVERWLEETSR